MPLTTRKLPQVSRSAIFRERLISIIKKLIVKDRKRIFIEIIEI